MRRHRTVSGLDPARSPVAPGESGLPPALPPRWQVWEDTEHDGVVNMATDQALLTAVQPGMAVWRWYGWSAPTVSFGRNERVAGRFSPAWLAEQGLAAVRRPTGGRALLHARELTYSVTLSLPRALPWRHAYDAVNALLLDTLRSLGIPVERSGGHGPVALDGPVCFDQPAEGELTAGGRKLVGSAVWRQGDAYLQHGSILLHDDQHRLLERVAGASPTPPAATLTALLPHHRETALPRLVYAASRSALQRIAAVEPFVTPSEWPALLASHRRHFADASWLWRR